MQIVLAATTGAERRIAEATDMLRPVLDACGARLRIVCEGDRAAVAAAEAADRSGLTDIPPEPAPDGIGALRRSLLAGEQEGTHRLAFVDDPARIDAALLAACDGVFVTLRPRPTVAPDREFGCTLITSVFRSDPFLAGFLNNCAAMTGYGPAIAPTLLVSTLSPREIEAFDGWLADRPNVTILWQRRDPGLYECWNIGLRLARTDFVSNANVDDLRAPDQVMTLVQELACHPEAAVAATALVPFEDYPADGTLPAPEPAWYADQAGSFGFLDLARPVDPAAPALDPHNLPHCMPVWRCALHERFGWFDETRFGTYADWAFWLKVLDGGNTGRLRPEPLSFYFVNPGSHNRRGADLATFHRRVEDDFLPRYLALAENRLPAPRALPPDTPRRLHLYGQSLEYGQHRNAFGRLVAALDPLDMGPGGCRFVPFLERQFVWGDDATLGEAASARPAPITEPWIGILHVPFDAPDWFDPSVSPETYFDTPLFRDSLPACRGIVTLCADLERDLNRALPDMPTLALRHPTELDVRPFDPAAYRARPRVVQVGDWLRKLQAIHRLDAPGHDRIMLLKMHTRTFLDREIARFGNALDPAVDMVDLLPDDAFDEMLASSVVLCLLYATAANNVVIECIARATPILINPLPAVVEYLGQDYPLYARDEAEADAHLATPGQVEHAHRHLLRRRAEIDLGYEGFCRDFAGSGFYAAL